MRKTISHICVFEEFGEHAGIRCTQCNEPARDPNEIAEDIASLLNELEVQGARFITGKYGQGHHHARIETWTTQNELRRLATLTHRPDSSGTWTWSQA
jgi:hypothetical protein